MRRILSINIFVVVALFITSCEKTEGFTALTDSPAELPVSVTNVYDYLPAPTVKASKAENKITITLQLPAESGRTIKEVTKIAVAGTASYGPIQNGAVVGRGANQLWSNTPVSVNSSSYTFTTTFTEAQSKSPTALGLTWPAASNALLGMDFYFQLKLDNDQTIIPTYVRVFVVD